MKLPTVLLAATLVVTALGCSKYDRSAGTPKGVPTAEPPGAPAMPATGALPSVPPTPIPAIKDIPTYAGAAGLALTTSSEQGLVTHQATFTTDAPYIDVVGFYSQAVVENGWTVVEKDSRSDGTTLKLTKGPVTGSVEVVQVNPQEVFVTLLRTEAAPA